VVVVDPEQAVREVAAAAVVPAAKAAVIVVVAAAVKADRDAKAAVIRPSASCRSAGAPAW